MSGLDHQRYPPVALSFRDVLSGVGAEDRHVPAPRLRVRLRSAEHFAQPESDPLNVLIGEIFEDRLELRIRHHLGVESVCQLEEGGGPACVLEYR